MDKLRASIDATIAEIADNSMTRIATDPDDWEAYEIVRRIIRRIDNERAAAPVPEIQPGQRPV